MEKNHDQTKTAIRPNIEAICHSKELRRWYWLKSELSAEAKRLGLRTTGAKFTLLDRICYFHDSGNTIFPDDKPNPVTSNFDWHTAQLSPDTVITDNYKNTQNVRAFFQQNTTTPFKFNIALLDWFKSNEGKTLKDALAFWQKQNAQALPTQIKPHNQFNQYCRDFIEQNPSMGMKDARRIWALKRRLPSNDGRHRYASSDLLLAEPDTD